jgi:hypothetical protein
MLTTRERPTGVPATPGDDATFLADLDRRFRVPLIRYFGKRVREAYNVDDADGHAGTRSVPCECGERVRSTR